MTFLPGMNAGIQRIKAGIGAVWGQTYDLYRLVPGVTNGSVVSGDPLLPALRVKVEPIPMRSVMVEARMFDLFCFQAYTDGTLLQEGDILVQTRGSIGYTGENFCVAQMRPPNPTILVRVETTCNVMHPYSLAGTASEQPDEGIIFNPEYGGPEAINDQAIVLQNGKFYPDSTYSISPSSITCGLVPRAGVSDSRELGLPTELPDTNFAIFVPLLPGYQISQNDKIKAMNQDTYVVRMDYQTGMVGIAGYILLVQRIVT